jgi:hypothetical protein
LGCWLFGSEPDARIAGPILEGVHFSVMVLFKRSLSGTGTVLAKLWALLMRDGRHSRHGRRFAASRRFL